MDSITSGSSSFRSDVYSSDSGMYIHPDRECGYSMMKNIGKVGRSPLSKNDEVPPSVMALSGVQDAPYMSTHIATWGVSCKTSGDEQPVDHCLQPCSFPAGDVKEEAFCYLYQKDSGIARGTTQSATYIRLGDDSQSRQSSVAAADRFQATQVYTADRPPHRAGFALTHLAGSVDSEVESTISGDKLDKDRAKELSENEDEDSRKKAKTDSYSDNSGEELQGKKPARTYTSISGPIL